MPFSRPGPNRRFFRVCLAVAAGVTCAIPASEARDGRKNQVFAVGELAAQTRHGYDEIIVQMAPLHPLPGAAKGVDATKPIAAGGARAVASSSAAAPDAQGAKGAPDDLSDAGPGGELVLDLMRSGDESFETSILYQRPGDVAAQEAARTTLSLEAAPQSPFGDTVAESVAFAPEPAASKALEIEPAAAPPALKEQSAERAPVAQASPPVAPAAVAQPPSTQSAAAPAAAVNAPASAPQKSAALPARTRNQTEAYAALLAQGVKGPAQVRVAERATLSLPAGQVFLEAEKARTLMGIQKGEWDSATQGLVLPVSQEPQWTAYVDLFDDGYVKDQNVAALDPKSLLAAHKAVLAAQNAQRAREDLTLLEVTGWITAPHYDAKHRFGSCVGATAQGSQDPQDRFVNCTSFALGRQGALKVVVVGDEERAALFKGQAAALAEAIAYDKGKAYEDVDAASDKAASYDLAALATGVVVKNTSGAATVAAAAKPIGLFAPLAGKLAQLWKALLVGLAVIVAAARWIVSKRKDSSGGALPRGGSSPPKARSALSALLQKAASLRRVGKTPNDSSAVEAQEVAPQAKALSKVAAIMRRKAPEPLPAVNLSRVTGKSGLSGDASGDAPPPPPPPPPPEARPLSGAATVTAAAATDQDFGLVEPGDKAAASMAISARAALRQARG